MFSQRWASASVSPTLRMSLRMVMMILLALGCQIDILHRIDAIEYIITNKYNKVNIWWGWIELNYLPSGYEPPALTDELQPQ
jgi:hypothetical protein